MLKRHSRLAVYGLVGAALLVAVMAAPATWAAPGASGLAQTIPSPTPTPAPLTPGEPLPPTVPPAETPAPGATRAPGSTVAPLPGGTSLPSAACAAATLSLVSDRNAVASGMTVVFTATLTNTGRQPLRQITLEDQLSGGLVPDRVISGQGAWQGRTLRMTSPALAAGARLVAVYSATVAPLQSAVITARASAAIAGCPPKLALLTLALPPSELPRTGGGLR